MAKLPVILKRTAITTETMAVGKKSSGGTITVQTVKLTEELNERLGIFRATHKPKMSNQDTLVAALTEFLKKHGR